MRFGNQLFKRLLALKVRSSKVVVCFLVFPTDALPPLDEEEPEAKPEDREGESAFLILYS